MRVLTPSNAAVPASAASPRISRPALVEVKKHAKPARQRAETTGNQRVSDDTWVPPTVADSSGRSAGTENGCPVPSHFSSNACPRRKTPTVRTVRLR